MKKTRMIGVNVDEEEWKMAQFLRNKYDMNISAFLRKCLRKRYKELKDK